MIKGENKRFVFVLVILLFLAVCLAIGIVLIKLNGSGTGDSVGLDEESLEIKSEVFERCRDSIDGYDEMEQTELLIKCSTLIMADDHKKEYSKEVLDVLVRVDNVLQTAASASKVMNAAFFYDEQDLMERYTEIFRERFSNETNNQEAEGVG